MPLSSITRARSASLRAISPSSVAKAGQAGAGVFPGHPVPCHRRARLRPESLVSVEILALGPAADFRDRDARQLHAQAASRRHPDLCFGCADADRRKPYPSPKTQKLFDWYLARCQRVIDTGPHPTHAIPRHFTFVSALAGVRWHRSRPVCRGASKHRP